MTAHAARNRKRVTGAILLGGKSSRMGTPKHLVALGDGRTMAAHVADALREVCGRIVVVGSAHGLESVGFEAERVSDLRPGFGPLGGIEALLASGIDDEYLVCPCDLPGVTAEVLRALLEETEAASTILRVSGDVALPLPARISARALPLVRAMLDEGGGAVRAFHARAGARVVDVPGAWGALLMNVNSPADVDALREHSAARRG